MIFSSRFEISGVNFSCYLGNNKQKRRSLVLCLNKSTPFRTTKEERRRGDIIPSVSVIYQNHDTSTWIYASITILVLTYHGYTEEMTKLK